MKATLLIAIYIATFMAGCLLLFSDGEAIERMILSDAPYARTSEERERIEIAAAATRLGFESSPAIKYIIMSKAAFQCVGTLLSLYIVTTVILLFYSDLKGSLQSYAEAFIASLWILSIANILNPALKLLLSRVSASISFALFIRPFDWRDFWHILLGRMDLFFIIYLVYTGFRCAAVAKINRSEAVALVTITWLAVYFGGVILGIDLSVSF